MRLFSFDWFKSSERKELEKLKAENLRLENKLLLKKLYDITKEESEEKEEKAEKPEKKEEGRPYRNYVYSGGHLTVVTLEGDLIDGDVDQQTFAKIVEAKTIAEISALLAPPVSTIPKEENLHSQEELNIIEENKSILDGFNDFVFKGRDVFLKGVELPIEPLVLASFIEIAERLDGNIGMGTEEEDLLIEAFEGLKMFWRWTALNPIASSRRDLMKFIKHNDVNITSNGLLELFRKVVKVGKSNKELVDFVSAKYLEIRRRKKATGDYEVVKQQNGYALVKEGSAVAPETERVGNLKELYLDLPNMTENTYTDAHTRKMQIKIGEVYKEDESVIDLDNNIECSRGLHVGSRGFAFSSFGDTGVIALVNPMKVRAVPTYDSNKMRVSEMFIAGVMDEKAYKSQEGLTCVADYSQEYFNIGVSELEKMLAEKSYGSQECQGNVPAVKIEDLSSIYESLKDRVVAIV